MSDELTRWSMCRGTLRTPTDLVFVKRAKVLKDRIVQSDPRLRRPSGVHLPSLPPPILLVLTLLC